MQPQVMLAMLPYLLQHRAMLDVNRLVNSCVRDPFLRQALSFHPLLIGGDPARTPALYGLIVEFERRWGVHYALGGTGALVDALGGLFERLGGRIVLGADVERVLVSQGRAVGVQVADSTTHAADVVVSNADPGFTYETLLGHEPRARPARARMRQARPSMSLHVLYFGADRTWPDSPLAHHNMLFARDQRAAMRRVFPSRLPGRAQSEKGTGVRAGEDMFLYVHMPTRTDPTIAPPGCEALYVLVATPARRLPSSDPQEESARVRAAVLDVLDGRYLPGLRGAPRRRALDRPRALPRRAQLPPAAPPSRCSRRCSSRGGSGRTTGRAPSGACTWWAPGRTRGPGCPRCWPRGRSPPS